MGNLLGVHLHGESKNRNIFFRIESIYSNTIFFEKNVIPRQTIRYRVKELQVKENTYYTLYILILQNQKIHFRREYVYVVIVINYQFTK